MCRIIPRFHTCAHIHTNTQSHGMCSRLSFPAADQRTSCSKSRNPLSTARSCSLMCPLQLPGQPRPPTSALWCVVSPLPFQRLTASQAVIHTHKCHVLTSVCIELPLMHATHAWTLAHITAHNTRTSTSRWIHTHTNTTRILRCSSPPRRLTWRSWRGATSLVRRTGRRSWPGREAEKRGREPQGEKHPAHTSPSRFCPRKVCVLCA